MVVVTDFNNLRILRLLLIATLFNVLIVFSSLYIESTLACRSKDDINNMIVTNTSSWGKWIPPAGNDSWKTWINLWGKENISNFDSTEEGRGPETGWPKYWKGLGKGNDGVPPPPWAYVPQGYGKPQFCFLKPVKGECEFNMTRWGFNPTNNKCMLFIYSGCGGNDNNFIDKESCKTTCVEVPSTGCESEPKINFEELVLD